LEKIGGAILKDRAVSPILATLILAAIVISAGLWLYAQISGMLYRQYSRIEVQVVSLDLYKFEDKVLFMASVKNTGSKPLVGIIVSCVDDNGKRFSLALPPAEPGVTVNNSLIIPLGVSNIVLDGSGNNYHGTIYGAKWTEGKVGKALSFDGKRDYVKVSGFYPNIGDNYKGSITATFQVKPSSKADGYVFIDGNKNEGYIKFEAKNKRVLYQFQSASTQISLSEFSKWHFAALATNGGSTYLKAFLDDYSKKVSQGACTGWCGPDGDLYLGYKFAGVIDDIFFCKQVLLDEEVSWNRIHPNLPVTRGLVLWLPLNEGSNDPYVFTSGNSYPITVTAYSLDGDVYTRTISTVCA